jgi:alpha-ribazole phosphatase/probable phosphoglycerate mutase
MTELYLIRHGEIEGEQPRRYNGHKDVDLTDNGRSQIRRLAYHLQDVTFSAIYASDLRRSVESAEILAQNRGVQPISLSALRERNFGLWEGLTFEEVDQRYPETFRSWAKNPLTHSPIGGESTLEARDRIIPALENIILNHPNQTIAVVAHGGVNRIILCDALAIPLHNIFRIEQDYAALNIIAYIHDYPTVRLMNFVAYDR